MSIQQISTKYGRSISRNLNDHFADMSLRFKICISRLSFLKEEDFVDDRSSSLWVGAHEADHILKPRPTASQTAGRYPRRTEAYCATEPIWMPRKCMAFWIADTTKLTFDASFKFERRTLEFRLSCGMTNMFTCETKPMM
jgi:hypothetical protein